MKKAKINYIIGIIYSTLSYASNQPGTDDVSNITSKLESQYQAGDFSQFLTGSTNEAEIKNNHASGKYKDIEANIKSGNYKQLKADFDAGKYPELNAEAQSRILAAGSASSKLPGAGGSGAGGGTGGASNYNLNPNSSGFAVKDNSGKPAPTYNDPTLAAVQEAKKNKNKDEERKPIKVYDPAKDEDTLTKLTNKRTQDYRTIADPTKLLNPNKPVQPIEPPTWPVDMKVVDKVTQDKNKFIKKWSLDSKDQSALEGIETNSNNYADTDMSDNNQDYGTKDEQEETDSGVSNNDDAALMSNID